MSMNLNLYMYGERTVQYQDGNGKTKTAIQNIMFDCWQTPTNVSYAIKSSNDPLATYIKWVTDNDSPYEEYQYADDNWLLEEVPYGKITVSPALNHLEKLSEWLRNAQEDGYTVRWSVL